MDPGSLWHFQELLRRVSWIAERLIAIEERLSRLEGKVAELENRPTTRIDKIDYSFEHLRVDTLSGTLVIGMTSAMDGKVDEFVMGDTVTSDLKIGNLAAPGAEGTAYPCILQQVRSYYETDFNQDLEEASREHGVALDEEWRTFIRDDLRSQLDGRILTYLKHANPAEEESAKITRISEQIKSDTRTALQQFFEKTSREGFPNAATGHES